MYGKLMALEDVVDLEQHFVNASLTNVRADVSASDRDPSLRQSFSIVTQRGMRMCVKGVSKQFASYPADEANARVDEIGELCESDVVYLRTDMRVVTGRKA